MRTEEIKYQDHNTALIGHVAYPDAAQPRPLVLICPDYSGRNEFADRKAEKIAELGYVGFALDVYGNGKIGKTVEEKRDLMQPFIADRKLLRQRLLAAYHTATHLPQVDKQFVTVIGFCFGGLCALDLARSGANLKGVVSFHGFFNAPEKLASEKITAKVLAFHGAEDPMVPFEQIIEFKNEMNKAKVDWQVHLYGHAMHAFTNPQAHDATAGTYYNAIADERSWQSLQNFLSEVFTPSI